MEAAPRHLERREVAGAVALVSGSPATGKSSLARRLAQASPRGVHFETDPFYEFVAHPIAPIRPESRAQNEAIAQAGYEVFADGVIGPWMLPHYLAELAPLGLAVDYLVLRAPLDVALARSHARDKDVPDEVVRAMHPKFAELGAYERHALDTGARDLEETLAEVARLRACGALRVSG